MLQIKRSKLKQLAQSKLGRIVVKEIHGYNKDNIRIIELKPNRTFRIKFKKEARDFLIT